MLLTPQFVPSSPSTDIVKTVNAIPNPDRTLLLEVSFEENYQIVAQYGLDDHYEPDEPTK